MSSQYYAQSKAHWRYLAKQAQSAMPQTNKKTGGYVYNKDGSTRMRSNPLDSRGQPHRAGRDEDGKIVQPGGGKADAPPSSNDAARILMRTIQAGIRYEDLPEKSPTKNAARKSTEHAKMRGKKPPNQDTVAAPASAPPGTRYMARRAAKNLRNSKEYISKSINEDFKLALDEALGL